MTKDEFIKNVLFAFRDFFSDEAEKQYWVANYNMGISNCNIDYEKLYKKFLTEYKSNARRPPLPSWFSEKYSTCKLPIQEESSSKIIDTGVPPLPCWYKMKENLKKAAMKNKLKDSRAIDLSSVGDLSSIGSIIASQEIIGAQK